MGTVKPVPEGFRTITPQLAIDGAAQAMEFYKRAFGAEEIARAPDPSGQKVWHGVLKIGDSMLFVNDVFPDMPGEKAPHHSSFWLYVEGCDRWFLRAVEAGCKAQMPPMDMFWGDRMGQVTDPFGHTWTIATRVKEMTPEEQKRAADAFVAQMKQGQKK